MTDPDKDGGLLLTRIVIERRLEDGGDMIWTNFADREDGTPPLFEILGLLELAKDTAIRQAMGEVPPDDDADAEEEAP